VRNFSRRETDRIMATVCKCTCRKCLSFSEVFRCRSCVTVPILISLLVSTVTLTAVISEVAVVAQRSANLLVPLDLLLAPTHPVSADEAAVIRNRASYADTLKGLSLCADCVPKRIHHTYKTEELPPGYAKLRASCMEVYPDYEFFLWTDASARTMIAETFGSSHVANFDSYSTHNIQRADALRYYVLYQYGGVYADLNTACVPGHRWDSLRTVPAGFCGTEPFGVTNDFMVAAPQHPFFGFLVDRLASSNHWWITPYLTVMLSAGPLFVSRSIAAYDPQRPTPHMRVTEPGGLPPSMTEADHFGALRGDASKQLNASGLAEHAWPRILPPVLCGRGSPDSFIAYPSVLTGSWHSWDVALARYIASTWYWVLAIVSISALLCWRFCRLHTSVGVTGRAPVSSATQAPIYCPFFYESLRRLIAKSSHQKD
jgi:hypothetical protein